MLFRTPEKNMENTKKVISLPVTLCSDIFPNHHLVKERQNKNFTKNITKIKINK